MLKNLNHLETLCLEYDGDSNYEDLIVALSPSNRNFSDACPQLKTVEVICIRSRTYISPEALFDFVWRRVLLDVDEPAPGLVTCLKLDWPWVYGKNPKLARLAKTHRKSLRL
jgi:hypothetical protein